MKKIPHIFFEAGKCLYYPQGQTLFRSNDHSPGFFYVDQGSVSGFIETNDGQKFPVITYKAGDIFPLTKIFNSPPKNVTYKTTSDTWIWHLEEDCFPDLVKSDKNILVEICSFLSTIIDDSALNNINDHLLNSH